MNTPNKITLSRLLLIPIIVFFYLADFIPYGRLVATIVFIVACLTDFLDGYLARKNNQVTDLGKFFDSIADKVLIMTGMILIVAVPVQGYTTVFNPTQWLGVTCIIIMLAREFIISALRQVAASKGIVLAADKGGKIKATVQYISVTLYMFFGFILTDIVPTEISESTDRILSIVRFILMVILIVATLLTIYSGASYLIRNRKVFTSEKGTVITDEDDEDKSEKSGEEVIENDNKTPVDEKKENVTEENKKE